MSVLLSRSQFVTCFVYVDHIGPAVVKTKPCSGRGLCETAVALPFNGIPCHHWASRLCVHGRTRQGRQTPNHNVSPVLYRGKQAVRLANTIQIKSNQINFIKFWQLWSQISKKKILCRNSALSLGLHLWGSAKTDNALFTPRRARFLGQGDLESVTVHEWRHCLRCRIFRSVGYRSDCRIFNHRIFCLFIVVFYATFFIITLDYIIRKYAQLIIDYSLINYSMAGVLQIVCV